MGEVRTQNRIEPCPDSEKRLQALTAFSPVAEATFLCQQGISSHPIGSPTESFIVQLRIVYSEHTLTK
jgi:hypothetical protein